MKTITFDGTQDQIDNLQGLIKWGSNDLPTLRSVEDTTVKKLYVISHTWRDTDMTIEHFHSPAKVLSRLSELTDFDDKPDPTDDPQEYVERYQEWCDDNSESVDCVVVLKVIDL